MVLFSTHSPAAGGDSPLSRTAILMDTQGTARHRQLRAANVPRACDDAHRSESHSVVAAVACKGWRTEYGRYHGGVEEDAEAPHSRYLFRSHCGCATSLVRVLLAALATESETDTDSGTDSVADLYGLFLVECK